MQDRLRQQVQRSTRSAHSLSACKADCMSASCRIESVVRKRIIDGNARKRTWRTSLRRRALMGGRTPALSSSKEM